MQVTVFKEDWSNCLSGL